MSFENPSFNFENRKLNLKEIDLKLREIQSTTKKELNTLKQEVIENKLFQVLNSDSWLRIIEGDELDYLKAITSEWNKIEWTNQKEANNVSAWDIIKVSNWKILKNGKIIWDVEWFKNNVNTNDITINNPPVLTEKVIDIKEITSILWHEIDSSKTYTIKTITWEEYTGKISKYKESQWNIKILIDSIWITINEETEIKEFIETKLVNDSKQTSKMASTWTIIDYKQTESSDSILWNWASYESWETLTENETYNDFQEKLLEKANNPKVKMIFALSQIWIDWARKAIPEQWSLMWLRDDKQKLEEWINWVNEYLNKIIDIVNNKDSNISEIDWYIEWIFTKIYKAQDEGEEILDNTWEIKNLFSWLNEKNYENRLAKMLELSAWWLTTDWNTEKSKEIARNIIIYKHFEDIKNAIASIEDIDSLKEGFFISLGLTEKQAKRIIKEIKDTYKEVKSETEKHRDEIIKNFEAQNLNFEWNLQEEIDKIISKTASIQALKMSETMIVDYKVDSIKGDKIIDTYNELNSDWQATKEWLADNWAMIAISLIPMGAWFATVWALAKWASWAMKSKKLADFSRWIQIAWNSAKWVAFYEWMNLTNNALYQDKFSNELLTWSLDAKELVKNALFFNIMWVVDKFVPAWERIISAQTMKSISSEVWLFTWVDIWVELWFNWEMNKEQFVNSLLTWSLMTIMSRWAWKLSKWYARGSKVEKWGIKKATKKSNWDSESFYSQVKEKYENSPLSFINKEFRNIFNKHDFEKWSLILRDSSWNEILITKSWKYYKVNDWELNYSKRQLFNEVIIKEYKVNKLIDKAKKDIKTEHMSVWINKPWYPFWKAKIKIENWKIKKWDKTEKKYKDLNPEETRKFLEENPEIMKEIIIKKLDKIKLDNLNWKDIPEWWKELIWKALKNSIFSKWHLKIIGFSSAFSLLQVLNSDTQERDKLLKEWLIAFLLSYIPMWAVWVIVIWKRTFQYGWWKLWEITKKVLWKPASHLWNYKWRYITWTVLTWAWIKIYMADWDTEETE